ncbi:MAG: YdiU family protein [Methylotenera sp.]|nr:YdiU family protein [Oligoflexia bacterium]
MNSLKFSDLPWESHLANSLPADPETRNFTRTVQEVSYSSVQPTPVRNPQLLGWSDSLAAELGISKPTLEDRRSVEILGGNLVLPTMKPHAARYGGHQFGHWAGQLGDGRAITLGEALTPGKGRFEYQLKGAGPTPYSRRADGRAVLRSSVREFLCSEAMHFLGVPTTRALSLVTTGDAVVRDMFYDGNAKPEPGAIVCRVAPSFLRFGNFEILASSGEIPLLKKLTDFLITDHYPELDLRDSDVYGKLLDEVSRRTAFMISEWMRVGFVHGVMNTDNMSVLGLTIDYGPYGWLEPYDPNWTPNTTDAQGRRYRYGNQPSIALWNLSRLAEALLPLIQDQARALASLELYKTTFQEAYAKTLAKKLGLSSIESEADQKLVLELFELLQGSEADMTLFFRRLCDWPTGVPAAGPAGEKELEADFRELIQPTFYTTNFSLPKWVSWFTRYSARVRSEVEAQGAGMKPTRSALMKSVNPKYVLRNYLAQNAITAAEKGDPSVLERLLRVLRTPYDEMPSEEDLAEKRPDWARDAPGCSALSCSS